jgi:uncharacterized protein (TIGR02147 family)
MLRLSRLGLIDIQRKRLVRTSLPIRTSSDLPSSAIRSYHKQNLRLVETAIDRDAVGQRDMTSITIPFDSKDMEEAKIFLKQMRRRFAKRMKNQVSSQIYTLAIQFFPVTRSPLSGIQN